MVRRLVWGLVVACVPALAAAASGRIYDAKTGTFVQGARLVLFYDDTDEAEPGQRVPDDRLLPGQQGQVSAAEGIYRFDLESGRRYRLTVEPPTGYTFPSQLVPATPGFAPPGAVVPGSTPSVEPGAQRIYYLRFDRTDVTNNHVPLDPLTALVVLEKRADRPAATNGEVVRYHITVENRSGLDLVGVVVKDRLDRGLAVVGRTPVNGEIRFEPQDLAAGRTLSVEYRAVVEADAPPGSYRNTAVAVDAQGMPVSNEATAVVRIASDPVFDQGFVLGRVYCDDDGNGRVGPGERGVYGARVALETGSWARTDSTGKYHLQHIEPGVHVVKLDEATLPPGATAALDAQVIYFTRGLPARVTFPVKCLPPLYTTLAAPEGSIRLSGKRPPPAPPPRTSATVTGDLAAWTVALDGKAVKLPAADVTIVVPPALELPAAERTVGPNLRPPGVGGYPTPVVFRGTVGDLGPRRWTLTLARNQGRVLRRFEGTGAPGDIAWDGLDGEGRPIGRDELIVYQLRVEGAGTLAASVRKTFGVAFGLPPGEEKAETWRGPFFTADREPKTTEALAARVRTLVRALGREDDVLVEVHDGGGGDALETLARTQRQAEAVRRVFVENGMSARRIRARGRGALVPVAPGATEGNRRVVVRVIPFQADAQGLPIPSAAPAFVEALVGGEPSQLDVRGRFAKNIPLPASGEVAIELQAADGRRAARFVRVGPSAPAQAPRPMRLVGDLQKGTLTVDGRPFDAWLLAVELGFRHGDTALPGRMAFEPVVPEMIEAVSWELAVWRATAPPPAEPIWRTGKAGPPPATIDWKRAPTTPGEHYLVRFAVEDARGGWGASPLRVVRVAGGKNPFAAVGGKGQMFTAEGDPTPELRERLAAFAAAAVKRPPERYKLDLRAQLPPVNEGERRLALAMRAGKVKAALTKLGAPIERVEIVVSPGAESLAVTAAPLPPPAAERATVDGRDVPLRGHTFDAAPTVAPGGAVVVEMVMADGHRAMWVIAAEKPGPRPPAPAPAPPAVSLAENPAEFGGKELEAALAPPQPGAAPAGRPARFIREETLRRPVEVPADVLAADLAVSLPGRGTKLASTELWISGKTSPKNKIRVGGTEAFVDDDGRFEALASLPVGASELVVESEDPDGNRGRLRWPVEVAENAHFLVGLVDGAIANQRFDGMTDHTTVSVGDAVLHGRIAAYYKGRFSGGDVFRRVEVTAQVDTAKQGAFEPFFHQVIDPARDPVLGDSAQEGHDANARGKVFARIQADESTAVVGSFSPAVDEGLFRYERTLHGASVDFQRSFGALDQRIKTFGAASDGRVARDVNVFRSTGGTLYYLRNRRLVEGGEQVRLIVRDSVSGLVLSERRLERNGDYVIDYPGGRIQLKAPVSSLTETRSAITNLASTQTPLFGNPVYLEVSYEYETPGAGAGAAGLYVQEKIAGFTLGGGIIGEMRDDARDYTLAGVDLTFQPNPGTRLRLEVAGTREVEARTFLSPDGGLSFQGLSAVGEQAASGTQLGWKVDFRSHLADVVKADWARKMDLFFYAQRLDRGFSSGGTALDQGRTKFGGEVRVRLDAQNTLTVRHDSQLADLPRVGPTPAVVDGLVDPLELDHVGSYLTSVQWARTGKKLDFTLQAAHQRLGSEAQELFADRYGVGGLLGWKASRRLTLRLGQEVQISGSDRDPVLKPIDPAMPSATIDNALAGVATSAGADMELAPGLIVSGTGIVRWNGDTAAVAGLKTPIDDNASMYLQQRLESRSSRLVSTSVVGGEERFGNRSGGRAYGEYQIESGVLGARNRAVMGVGHRFAVARGLNLSAGFEHQQTRGGYLPDGTPTGDSRRDVVSFGAEYVRRARIKASAVVEARFDEGVTDIDPSFGPLVASDTRRTSPPGTFPDHGGVAPGAPLALLPGERTQLVGRAACDLVVAADHTLLLRVNAADTRAEGETFARFVEATAGWAFRPLEIDWLDLLVHYSFVYERRPGEATGESSHVVAASPILDLPWNLRLAGKVAYKHTNADVATDAILGLLRLGWLFQKKWDVALEFRLLRVGRDGGAELRYGPLLEVAYFIDKRIRLGVGYNFSHFSDNLLADLDEDVHGFFFRVVGRY